MKRRALLIGAPGALGEDGYLPGVRRDLMNYHDFFVSPLGGAWRESEIQTLINPTRHQVREELGSLRTADYSIAIFSGHGHDHRREGTIIALANDQTMSAKELED